MASRENIPEISLTATEFRGRLKSAYQDKGVKAPRKIHNLGVFADGTRYLVEDGTRGISYYLVTDLFQGFPISKAAKSLTATANHLTTNATTTLTSSDAWIIAIAFVVTVVGTASTITVQDKVGTPKKLVNAAITTALNTTPTTVFPVQPLLMTSGIDIITAGTGAATIDIWITYLQ